MTRTQYLIVIESDSEEEYNDSMQHLQMAGAEIIEEHDLPDGEEADG